MSNLNQKPTYEEIEEMLPAYVLGALEPEELLAVDDYIQAHWDLLHRVERMDIATAQMALAAPAVDLPAAPKANLMAMIEADLAEQEPSLAPAAEELTPSLPPPAFERPAQLPAEPASGRRFVFAGPRLSWAMTAVAAAAAMILVIFYGINTQGRINELENTVAQRDQAITDMAERVLILEQEIQGEQDQLALFTDASRIVTLAGTESAPGAAGTFFQKGDEGILVMAGLDPLPTDQTYQLWLIPADGAPVPSGFLEVAAGASAQQTVAISDAAQSYAAVGISIEPTGGSPAPTGPIVALGQQG